jgi:hypothetical protein
LKCDFRLRLCPISHPYEHGTTAALGRRKAIGCRIHRAVENNHLEPQASGKIPIEYPASLSPGAWNWKIYILIMQNRCKEILKIFCGFPGIFMRPLENLGSPP